MDEIQSAIHDGVMSGLSRGPKLGFPVSQVHVEVQRLGLYSPALSTASAIRSAAYACVQKMLSEVDVKLLEPVMKMEVRVPPAYVGGITRDLSGPRRGMVNSIESIQEKTVIYCTAPLSQLIGYASTLRGMTQGTGEWIMELQGYETIGAEKEAAVMKQIRGY